MTTRFPLALPFALLASLAACSSSSSTAIINEGDTGPHVDTGIPGHDAGTPDSGGKETGPGTEAGKPDTGGQPDTGGGGTDAGSVTPAPGSTLIAKGLVQIIGETDDDYIIYYDATSGVSAADITGTVTQIIAGPPDGGTNGPEIVGLGGNIVAILSNYTTQSVQGTTEPISGTLSIWSHTKTGGVLKTVAMNATGIINIAADSSYVAYADGADAHGKTGNIGVIAGDGTGAVDILKGVAIDTTAATCEPFAEFDGKYVVTSTCSVADGGAEGVPAITSFDSTAAYAPVVLTATGGPNAPFTQMNNSVDFATDTAGDDVLTVTPAAGGTLSLQPITGGAAAVLSTTFGALTGGNEYFSLASPAMGPSFALFTETDGSYNRSTFTPPSTTATTTQLAPAGSVAGVFYTSPDLNYQIDYSVPIGSGDLGPASLNLRSTKTANNVFALIAANSGLASSFPGGFTADSKYALFTTGLKTVGTQASTGTLKVAAVSDGTIATIDNSTSVWDATALTGSKVLYNTNYVASLFTMAPNGAAIADMYVTDASSPSQGTLVVKGADAPNGFYVTKDKSHMFYSFTVLTAGEGGVGILDNGDGLYSVALP